MDNKFELKRKKNLCEAIKRIQQINEYTYYGSSSVEEDGQDQNNPQDGGNVPPMGGGADPNGMNGGGVPNGMGGNMTPMDGGTDPNMGGDMSPMGGGDLNAMNGNGGMPPMDGGMDTNMGGDMPPMGGGDSNDMGDDGFEDIEMDGEQSNDEVVDVDDLTQSQETTEFKVDNLDDKLTKVLNVIDKFADAIASNDQKIEDLKQEFAKRNPTAEETLNLRSLASYPFSERPDEYWKKQQEEHPNYNVISNNDVPTAKEQQEFQIKKGDIDNFNEREIMKSLGESQIKLADFIDF